MNIRFEDVARALQYNITPRLMDFLEIASYIFTADCSTVRGKWNDDTKEEPWTRDLAFIIAVREPEFWASSQVTTLLREVLQFLSNDVYSFRFVPLDVDRPKTTPYFGFPDREDWPFHRPHRVLMFSGGLDSLAGIVETGA